MTTKRRNESLEIACYTGEDGVRENLFANHVYDSAGVLIALYYTDAAGVVFDTSLGVVTPSACPISQPDVEYEKLCDIQEDGTAIPFMCRTITSFDASGMVIDPVTVDLFELDKITPYVVIGTVGECDTCPDQEVLGLITDLSLLS